MAGGLEVRNVSAMQSTLISPVEETVSRIRQLHAHVLSHKTATEALASWCAARRIGDGPIQADVVSQESAGCRGGAIWVRRARLMRGPVVLSHTEIRFRTDVLSADMLQRLLDGGEPFGAIVAPLRPWRTITRARAAYGETILSLHATVLAGSGQPIARVRESYRRVLIEGGM
jgi:hypothetical protein